MLANGNNPELLDPKSYKEAIRGYFCHWTDWRKAIQDEIDSLSENNTWSLSSLLSGSRALEGKWVHKLKRWPAGEYYALRFDGWLRDFLNVKILTIMRRWPQLLNPWVIMQFLLFTPLEIEILITWTLRKPFFTDQLRKSCTVLSPPFILTDLLSMPTSKSTVLPKTVFSNLLENLSKISP